MLAPPAVVVLASLKPVSGMAPLGEDMETEPVAVLIVDDQEPFRRAARAVLARSEGFELVGEAASGEEALARVQGLRP